MLLTAEPGNEVEYRRWDADVFGLLQALPPASAPPVCEWTSPEGKIAVLEDDEEDDERGVPMVYAVSAVLFAALATAVWYFNHREMPAAA